MSAGLRQVASLGLLRASWDAVLANDAEDGILGAGVTRFACDAETHLEQIAGQIAAGEYVPGLLTRHSVPREDGTCRLLHVPTVRDRVAERAVLTVLTPVVDPWLGPWSFAYRPGLGVADAVQAVARLREEGLGWVARADVADCFPSIPLAHLRRLVAVLVGDEDLRGLVEAFLARRSAGEGGIRAVPGLAQGSPLSPLWANLVLTRMDERLADAGFPLVRYSDDFAVLAASRDEAWEGMRVASDAAGELGMRLGSDKSEVMSFDDGFTFLGEDFGPRYPPALDDHRAVDPPRRVVYAGLQGSRVRLEAGRLVVESPGDQELLNVASGQVERLVCFGAVGVSAGVRSWALANGVDLVFLSRRGSYLGHARGGGDRTRVSRLRAQLAASDDPARCVAFGRAVVEAKVSKQIVVLRRLARRHNAETVAEATGIMGQLLVMLPDCSTREELMGMEGAAARAYFGALGAVMPDGLTFSGRSRRPPQDTVNAALSYGYTILAAEAVSALCAAGLDPAIGLLHADADRRPSLALDLMEEFRPQIVDQVVLAAVNRDQLQPHHGRREDGVSGVLLTRAGREVVIDGYEKRMLQMTRGALPGFSGSLRRHLYRQAEQRRAPAGHARMAEGHFSGGLRVTVTARTPLLIGGRTTRGADGQERQILPRRDGNSVMIPGSSLLGAVRSLHEAVAGGCLRVLNADYVPVHRQPVTAGADRDLRFAVVEDVDARGRPAKVILTGADDVVWIRREQLVGFAGRLPRTGDVVTVDDRLIEPGQRRMIRTGTVQAHAAMAAPRPGTWVLLVTDTAARAEDKPVYFAAGRLPSRGWQSLTVTDPVWKEFTECIAGTEDMRRYRQQHPRTEPTWSAQLLEYDDVRWPLQSPGGSPGPVVAERLRARPFLHPGQPVWVRLEKGEVAEMRLSRIWRYRGSRPVAERAGHAGPCTDATDLCRSCRIFGSVDPTGRDDDEQSRQKSYRGHVRIDDLVADGDVSPQQSLPGHGAPCQSPVGSGQARGLR